MDRSLVLALALLFSLTTQLLAAEKQEDLNSFLDDVFKTELKYNPEIAAFYAVHIGDQSSWYDRSFDLEKAKIERTKQNLARLEKQFSAVELSPHQQLISNIYRYSANQEIESLPFVGHAYAIETQNGQLTWITSLLLNFHQMKSVQDVDNFVKRLESAHEPIEQMIKNIEIQQRNGILAPNFVYAQLQDDIIGMMDENTQKEHFLVQHLRTQLPLISMTKTQSEAFVSRAKQAIQTSFKQALMGLSFKLSRLEVLTKGVNNGVWALPNGAQYYRYLVSYYTTTDMGPDEIHEIGLKEVKRLKLEMESIKEQVNFKGSLGEFFNHIKHRKDNYYPNDEVGRNQFLSDANRAIDEARKVAHKYFNNMPRTKLEVRKVEEWRLNAGIGFYNRPPIDGTRPGYYYVNLKDMNLIQKYIFEAIHYHEGIPGHHFQLALAQELPNLPDIIKTSYFGAFIEGWGLYAEKLAKEMGLYTSPYHDFGRLQSEMWRAIRLVVDTGIHRKKWSKERAVSYFKNNSAMSNEDIKTEVERYFLLPGQALSYKIGMLKIIALRELAERELNDRFDIKDFHDVVLNSGSVPLSILEENVRAYILRKK